MKYEEELILYYAVLSVLLFSGGLSFIGTILLLMTVIGLLQLPIFLLGILYTIAVPPFLLSYYWFVSAA